MQVSKRNLERALIRKYRPEDRAELRKICYDAGLMGDPIDPYFGCLDFFADYRLNYHTDYEPESTFVAEMNGRVVGYLAGCRNTSMERQMQKRIIFPRMVLKLLALGYKIDNRFFSFMWRYLRSMWRGEFLEPPMEEFPAHLHMNMADGFRGAGIGSKLMAVYLDYLLENNVKGLYLCTTSHNRLAIPLYKKWGFRLVSSYPMTRYDGIVAGRVESLLFVRDLA